MRSAVAAAWLIANANAPFALIYANAYRHVMLDLPPQTASRSAFRSAGGECTFNNELQLRSVQSEVDSSAKCTN